MLALFGAPVAHGRCLSYGEGLTYWPVVEILKQAAASPATTPRPRFGARSAAFLPACAPPAQTAHHGGREAKSDSAVHVPLLSPNEGTWCRYEHARPERSPRPGRACSPCFEARDRLLELRRVHAETAPRTAPARRRGRWAPGGERIEHIPHRQAVDDDEHRPLGAAQADAVAADVAADSARPALAAAGRRLFWSMRSGPGAVVGEGEPLELAEADVVQLGHDEPRNVAARKGEVGRLPRALELAHDAEVERLSREQLAEAACLGAAGRGEAEGDARVAVRAAGDGEFGRAGRGSPSRRRGIVACPISDGLRLTRRPFLVPRYAYRTRAGVA